MTRRADAARSRRDFHEAQGVLLVTREPPPAAAPAQGQPPTVPANPAEGPEILLAVWDDGSVTALHGHVDLGTGIRTALAQIAADELDLRMDCVKVVLGDTASAPNQGATIASASIQVFGVPLRCAAAQARAWLVEQAAERLQVPVDALIVRNGVVRVREEPDRRIAYGELLRERHVELSLSAQARVKTADEYRLVGTSVPRVDIPAKADGELIFVHDMRVPGMLHGRVVRPPYAGVDAGEFVGNTLEAVDEASIAHIPGIVAVVVIRDFVGVVALREEHAEQAMRELKVAWKPWPGQRDLSDLEQALRTNPSTRRVLAEQGDVAGAIAGAAQPMQRSYVWPYQMHASIGPSCALAHWHQGLAPGLRCATPPPEGATPPGGGPAAATMKVWTGSQNPHVLRADLAKLMALPDTAIEVVRMEAAGCYGRNCADDVAADAALLSRAVGKPVRVQLSREQEHAWEPKGAAQLMQVDGGLNADGTVAAYDFQTSYPSNAAPTLALLLTRTIDPSSEAFEMGDRTAVPPYDYCHLRVVANDMAPILRAAWLRGVSALPNSFAHESYIDELATAAGADPVEFRLRHLKDSRAIDLINATSARAGWIPHTTPQRQPPNGDWLKGQGFAYARYFHSKFPGFGSAWAAWVADVEVNRNTGEVHVSRVVVGHDAGTMINLAGVQQQVHGNVVQTTSRALKERVELDPKTHVVASREWGSYPILNFREVPVIEVVMMPRQGEAPLGAGESSSVPGTAAIANAIFDATGVRFRQPPFTAEVVRAALNPLPAPAAAAPSAVPVVDRPAPVAVARRRKAWWVTAGALATGIVGLGAAALGWRPAIAPVAPSSATVFTAETIARGRQLAALGDCVVCHTVPGGIANAGGRAMQTPFGTVHTSNLTPDPQTGIGLWSFSAFQRAMREGISRDGHHLYPAFPYTAFTQATDDDLIALYAWLMAQPPVRSEVPATALAFPFNLRPLMALWNALYLMPGPAAQPQRSAQWNRGAYLVDGLGHCAACHSPRNALGAEQSGAAYLAGAVVEGWEAPALTSLSHSPVPWTQDALFNYLRFGHSREHGAATGPMAPVVAELATLPEDDVRAMAHYLASFNPSTADTPAIAQAALERSRRQAVTMASDAQQFFTSACGACHHDGNGPMVFGQNLPLALSSKLHSPRPDNLLRVILEGIPEPATSQIGFMPAFRDGLDDRQLARLAAYMRARFAPDKPAWAELEGAAARVRASQP